MNVPARPVICLAATLACATAALAGAIPHAHAFDTGQSVVGVWYTEDGLIKVLTREAVDPSSIDLNKIGLNACTITECTLMPLTGQVSVHLTEDDRVVEMTLPPAIRETLLSSQRASLVLEDGAYRSAQDGKAIRKANMMVVMPDDHIAELLVRAEYDFHADRLSLHFADTVDVSSVDWDGIYLVDGLVVHAPKQALRPFLGLDPVIADGRLVVFEFDFRSRSAMENMTSPVLHLGAEPGQWWEAIYIPGKSAWFRNIGLTSAEYLADDNRLHLRFTDQVNYYLVRTSLMHFGGIPRDTYEMKFVEGSDDWRAIILEISPSGQYALSLVPNPQIFLKPGAVSLVDWPDFDYHYSTVGIVAGNGGFFPPNPNIPVDLLVERADYDRATGEMTVRFSEAIDPSSVNASRIITVYDRCDGTIPDDPEMIQVAGDGRSAVIQTVGDDDSDALRKVPMLVRLGQGFFATEANGTENAAGDIPVPEYRPGPIPIYGGDIPQISQTQARYALHITQEMMPCRLTYSVNPLSSILNVSKYGHAYIDRHDEIVTLAVRDGLVAWSELNPFIIFEEAAGEEADITLEWMWLRGFRLGEASYSSDEGGIIRSVVRVPGSDGNWDVVGYDLLRNTVTHEFGHLLGLGHHTDPDHIMWGQDEFVQDPFDTLGYNIPPKWKHEDPGIFGQ